MKLKVLMTLSAVVLFSGCAPKTFINTSPIMSYDLTNVDISTLKSSKVCSDGSNTDTSVRHAAEIANMSIVYGVDNHVVYETHLFGGPTVKSRCVIVYGTDTNATVIAEPVVEVEALQTEVSVSPTENNTTVVPEDETNIAVDSNTTK